jgi:C4-dicarboxylate-specific signal transduction histidine kinase
MDGYNKKLHDYFIVLEESGVDHKLLAQGRTLVKDMKEHFDKRAAELDHLQTIIDHVPCTISHVSKDLKYLAVNKFLADKFEIVPEKFVGQNIGFQSTHNHFNTFTKNFFNSHDKQITHEIENIVNDKPHYYFVHGIKIKDETEALMIGIDITELTMLKDTVVFLDRLSSIGEMMAGILHEISNPLMLIKSYGAKLNRMVEKDQFDEEKIAKSADIICRTSDKIEKIVAGIKEFVRMSDDVERKNVDFETILADSVLICESALHESGVELIQKRSEWPHITVNETQIFQVFVNLITNAVHAIEDNEGSKWIEIDWSEKESCYTFFITDSGTGIPEEVREVMFSSFYTTKGVGKGTGLGLSLCFKIIESHGGHIYVDSTHKNTRFVIDIPKFAKEETSS